MLFIPLGILFLAQYAGEYPLACAAMFAFGGSLATEVLQYILKMDTFCTEDMICAALGGVLGALLVLAWKKTQGKKSLGGIVLRIVFGLCSFVFVLGIVTFGTYHVLRMTGEKSMRENMQFGEGNLIMLQGEAKAGKVYDEFYVDDAKLYELILNTFYTEVALK